MKATLFVPLLLSLGVTATPATDTVTIEDGGYTYTGIDKVRDFTSACSHFS
jgi:hypothetical protein